MRTSSLFVTSVALALSACSNAASAHSPDSPDASASSTDARASSGDAGGGDSAVSGSPTTDAGAVGTGDSGGSRGACTPPALLDCSAAANQSDPRCLPRPSQETAGTVGSGFAPAQLDSTTGIGSGFVDAASCRLISVLRNFQVAEHGVVFATNLATGARSVVSGTYDDPASGSVTVGAASAVDGGPGPDLDGIEDVQPEPSGKWLAYIQKPMTDEQRQVTTTASNGNVGPVSLAQESSLFVYPYPGSSLFIVTLETGVVLFDPATNDSNLLSR